MKNAQSIFGSIFCIFLGAWTSWGGVKLKLFDLGVPASGLFPFLFGTALTLIGLSSLTYDVISYRSHDGETASKVDYSGVRKVLAYIGLSMSCTILIPHIGFIIPCFLLLLIIFVFVENIHWKPSLYLAAGFTIFCDVLFIRALGVQLQSFII